MPRPFHVHWRHRGEVVCGATMTAAQHAKRSTDNPRRVTCPRCIEVQFAMVGASDLRYREQLRALVQDHVAALPKSGWVASRIRAAFLRATDRTCMGESDIKHPKPAE